MTSKFWWDLATPHERAAMTTFFYVLTLITLLVT